MVAHRFVCASFKVVVALVMSLGFFLLAPPALALTNLPASISGEVTLTKADSPYLLYLNHTVEAGANLIIEPGVIIKGGQNGVLNIEGNLDAWGSAEDPIIFTSEKDDTHGGDSNGDGSASVPEPGNWGWLRFMPSSTGELRHAEITYGGVTLEQYHPYAASVIVEETDVLISNVRITDGGDGTGRGITLLNSSATIEDSFIAKDFTNPNNGWGIWVDGGSPIIVRNDITRNGRGGIAVVTNVHQTANPTIADNRIFGNGYTFTPVLGMLNEVTESVIDVRNNWWGDDAGPWTEEHQNTTGQAIVGDALPLYEPWTGQAAKNPVLFIPGITGTALLENNDVVWVDPLRIGATDDAFLNVLQMKPDGAELFSSVRHGEVIDKIEIPFRDDVIYYESLKNDLVSLGYQEEHTLFTLPYDWRVDNSVTANILTNKINAILFQTGASKVDVITHSMGGLIAKKHITNHPNDHGIGKLIFMGTPHLGAPKSAKSLLFGDDFHVGKFVNQDIVRNLLLNMYSVYQLLPNLAYFNEIGGYFQRIRSVGDPQSETLSFAETRNLLLQSNKNVLALDSAEAFHVSDMQAIDYAAYDIEAHNIAGCNSPTINQIIELQQIDGSNKYLLGLGEGDETVPYASASASGLSLTGKYLLDGANHGNLPADGSVRILVEQILGGSVDVNNLPNRISTDINNCGIAGTFISVHSPVNLHAYDQSGNHIGLNDLGNIDENIVGATYEQLGEDKFIFLPGSEEYTVALNGSGDGVFDFRIIKYDGQPVSSTYYHQVPVLTETEAVIVVSDNSANDVLSYDYNGSGTFVDLPADVVLNDSAAFDVTAPITSIELSGAQGVNNWHVGDVLIELTGVDSESGVLQTEYRLGSETEWQLYTEPFTVAAEGVHSLEYRSINNFGVPEPIQTQIIKIDTTPPEFRIDLDLSAVDLHVGAIDNLSAATVVTPNVVTKQTVTYTALDEAGNSTVIVLDERIIERTRNGSIRAKLVSLRYNNGAEVLSGTHRIQYRWAYDKKGVLRTVASSLSSAKTFTARSTYTSRKAETKLVTKAYREKAARETKLGIYNILLKTNNGQLKYEITEYY